MISIDVVPRHLFPKPKMAPAFALPIPLPRLPSQSLNLSPRRPIYAALPSELPQRGGLQLPSLSPSDKQYISSASSDKERMRRVTEIARRLDSKRQQEGSRTGRMTSDDYLDSLRAGEGPYGQKVQEEREKLLGNERENLHGNEKDEVHQRAEDMQEALREMAVQEGEVIEEVDEKGVQEMEEKIREVQRQLREVAGVSEDDLAEEEEEGESVEVQSVEVEEASAAVERKDEKEGANVLERAEVKTADEVVAVAGKEEVVEKQITFLESYLEKLKADDASEAEGGKAESGEEEVEEQGVEQEDVRDVVEIEGGSAVKVDGLSGMAGEMSVTEKQAAFAAIRRASLQREEDAPQMVNGFGEEADLNPIGGAMREIRAKMEVEMGTIGGEEKGDVRKIVAEMEVEVEGYLSKMRALLAEHEKALQKYVQQTRFLLDE